MSYLPDPNTLLRHRAAEINRLLVSRRQRPRRNPERPAVKRLFDQLHLG